MGQPVSQWPHHMPTTGGGKSSLDIPHLFQLRKDSATVPLTPKLPYRRPQSERRHYVFLDCCGCPFGVAEETDDCKSEDDAWDMLYDTRAEERAARANGVRVEYVDHATYERDFYELMRSGCKHR